MTSPSSGRSPLQVGGVALLGVAVVTALVGLASLGAGNGDDEGGTAAAQTVPTSTAPQDTVPLSPPGETTTPGTTPQPTFTPGDGLAEPPSAGPAPAPGGVDTQPQAQVPGSFAGAPAGGGTAAAQVPVRVYNNSTIHGLAARAAEDFRRMGWRVDEVGNYPHGIIPTSTVYYRSGTSEEAAARQFGQQFDLRVEPRFEGIQDASPGLIVIVTRDYRT